MHRDSNLLAIAVRQAQASAAADRMDDFDGRPCALFEALRSVDHEDRERRQALIDRVLSLASSTHLAILGE